MKTSTKYFILFLLIVAFVSIGLAIHQENDGKMIFIGIASLVAILCMCGLSNLK